MDDPVDPLIGQTFYFTPAPQKEDAPRGGNGSQVLPVAELSDDFSGIPQDGMEYLFLVRREASTHAKVYRASKNPYEEVVQEKRVVRDRVHSSKPSEEWREAFLDKFKKTRFRMNHPPTVDNQIEVESIPAPKQESAWRIFINGKRSKPLPAPTAKPAITPSASVTTKPTDGDTEMLEEEDLESAKASILASLELDTPLAPSPSPAPSSSSTPASQSQPEYLQLPQLPTPLLLLAIPSTSLIHVLGHFVEWFEERLEKYREVLNWVPSTIFAPPALRKKSVKGAHGAKPLTATTGTKKLSDEEEKKKRKEAEKAPLPTPHEVQWILSLLSRLNDLLDGDDLSNLRRLGKTLLEMIETSETKASKSGGGGGVLSEKRREEEEEEEGRARCWMCLAAIGGVWKQEDLWNVNL
ncbi:SIP1 domain-containing protein [Sporobolomyces salmoneus]|uniref:SIP1 domain-containing protein n=1 Tax=Sporobolomyces salmoneus TaxID=183962 RepID=UPI00317F3197